MTRFSAVLLAAALSTAAPSAQPQSSTPPRPPITGISHVAFRSSDVAAARRFYGEFLGLPQRPGPARERVRFAVGGQQSVQVEPGLRPEEDERLSHVAYATPDVAAMERYLQARGLAVTRASSECDESAIRVRDPDGHAIEFVQATWPPAVAPAAAREALSTRLLHAGVVVRDEQAAHAFYRDVLGFSEIWRGGRPEGVTNWVNMRVPNGTDYLEYMLYAKAPDRRQRGSAHHVCLRVTDVQEALETAATRSAAMGRQPPSPPSVGVNGKWQLNLFDPDGTRVELMEPFRTR